MYARKLKLVIFCYLLFLAIFTLRSGSTLRRGSLPQQKGKSSAEFQLTEVGIKVSLTVVIH